MSVVIETTLGDITVDLFLHQRPVTCLNFLKLCKMKYYNFNLFHSIRSGFIAQTGDPTGEGTKGESVFGVLEGPEKRFFSGEKLPKIRHSNTGTLSMVCSEDMMVGSQFFFTLAPDLDSLDSIHCVIGEVTEGHDVLRKLNDVICDEKHRPYRDVRITHTVVLEDPFNDPAGLIPPSRSPSPSAERLKGGRIAPDEDIDEAQGKSAAEIQEMIEEKEAKARATILEIVGDLPDADIAPPENVLFVCKLNPVTTDEDLEIIFSRFGTIVSCEVIRDKKTGDSLQYAFVEFSNKKSCEDAYFKMDNVLIDDRRIHVDFSQSVSKMRYLGKGRGVQYFNDNKDVALPAQSDKKSTHCNIDDHRNGKADKRHENKDSDRSRDRHSRKERHTSRDRTRKRSRSRHRHSPKRSRRSRSRSKRTKSISRDRKHDRKDRSKDKGRDSDRSRDRKNRSPHTKSSRLHHDRSLDSRRHRSGVKDGRKSRDKSKSRSPSHSKKLDCQTDRKDRSKSSRHRKIRTHSKSPTNHSKHDNKNAEKSKRTRKSRSRSPIEIINGSEQEKSNVSLKKPETKSNNETYNDQLNKQKLETDLDQKRFSQSEDKVPKSRNNSMSAFSEKCDDTEDQHKVSNNWQDVSEESTQSRKEIHQLIRKGSPIEHNNVDDDFLKQSTEIIRHSISRSRSTSPVDQLKKQKHVKTQESSKISKQLENDHMDEKGSVISDNVNQISVVEQESFIYENNHANERSKLSKILPDKQVHLKSQQHSQSSDKQRKTSEKKTEKARKQTDNKNEEDRPRIDIYDATSGKNEDGLQHMPKELCKDHQERSRSASFDRVEQDKLKNNESNDDKDQKLLKEKPKKHKEESKEQIKQLSQKSKEKKNKKSTSTTKISKKTIKKGKKVTSKKKRKYSTSSSSDSSETSSSESSSSSEDDRKKKRRKRKASTSSSSSDSSSSSSSSSDSSSSSSESEPSKKKRKKVSLKSSKKSKKKR